MRCIYLKPELMNLSQGVRISFARQIRRMTQDEIAKELGIFSESRRIVTRYEKGERTPEECRTKKIANILEVNYNAIKNMILLR